MLIILTHLIIHDYIVTLYTYIPIHTYIHTYIHIYIYIERERERERERESPLNT